MELRHPEAEGPASAPGAWRRSAMGNTVYIGRQPMFNDKLDVVAYDLLYRDSEENRADVVDNAVATSRVIVDALMEFGLERIVGDHEAVVKTAASFLSDERLLALPQDRVMFELLETPHPDERLLSNVRALTERGYRIALGDFFYTKEWAPLLDLVHLVKLDVSHMNRFQVDHQVEALRRHCVLLLACKVDSLELLERTREQGFDYFMGHFLAQPSVAKANRMPTARMAVLRLLAELNNSDADAAYLERLVAADVSLGYRLLRYINSPAFGVLRKVGSIRQAIILLGLVNVRRWATLISLVELNDKPHELMVTAMVRARMCEALAHAKGQERAEAYFTSGLFSVVDALTDTPMEQVIRGLPLADEIREALIGRGGPCGEVLAGVIAYEQGEWEKVDALELATDTIRGAYLDALAWAEETSQALHGAG
jgi:EAL and modified HD-GYP domain-containing signal transduction protein